MQVKPSLISRNGTNEQPGYKAMSIFNTAIDNQATDTVQVFALLPDVQVYHSM